MNEQRPNPGESGEPHKTDGPRLKPLGPVEQAGENVIFTSSTTSQGTVDDLAEETASNGRYSYAYESDFLDNAVLSYEEGAPQPVIEMVSGNQKPERKTAKRRHKLTATTTDSAGESGEAISPFIEMIQSDGAEEEPTAISESEETEAGFVDKTRGWRPTGTVFFETMSTPPRGTIYRTRISEGLTGQPKSGAEILPEPDFTPPKAVSQQAETRPRFEFPSQLVQPPPEDTREVVSRKTRRRGGFFRRYIRAVILLGLTIFVLAVLCILGAGFAYYRYAQARLYESELTGQAVVVTVKPGEPFNDVIGRLRDTKLLSSFMGINDRYLMKYLAATQQNAHKVKPGAYRIDTGLALSEVYNKMIDGSEDFKVTIPEGFTAQDIANLVKERYPTFDAERFMQLVQDAAFIAKVGVDAPTLEGYLYPSTYYYGPGVKEEELIKLMVKAFHEKAKTLPDPLPETGLTFHEHVIMASLIEREARLNEDRPLIASVIFNRLKAGMPLQIDATVNYALGDWRRLTFEDYKVEHPYNTYKMKGLPPGPITSPRIESLSATFTPITSNYLYYVHRGDGRHAFAATYDEHQENVARYIQKTAPIPVDDNPLVGAAAADELPVVIIETLRPTRNGEAASVPVVPQPKSY